RSRSPPSSHLVQRPRRRQLAAGRQRTSRGGSTFGWIPPATSARLHRWAELVQRREMHRDDKERVVAELTEKLRSADTLIVADYRGLTMPQIDGLRGKLLEQGARLSVVKNTLTRRAAEAAGAEQLLALLEGPTAIAFVETDGDPVAVAKALADSARDTKV